MRYSIGLPDSMSWQYILINIPRMYISYSPSLFWSKKLYYHIIYVYNINYLRYDISSFVNVVTTYRCAWNVNNYDSKLDKHKILAIILKEFYFNGNSIHKNYFQIIHSNNKSLKFEIYGFASKKKALKCSVLKLFELRILVLTNKL